MSNEPRFALTVDADIELRLPHASDAQELFRLIDSDRLHLRQWLPWVDYETTLAESLEFVQRSQLQYEKKEGFQLGIFYQGSLSGVIGYHTINWPGRHVEIGYWLNSAFEGRGIMTRACRRLVSYAFDELTLNRVGILCAVGNSRSRAIPERLGFTQEGILRDAEWLYNHFVDLVIYSMLAREWPERNH